MGTSEHGSVLMLMPAAVLIVIVLAAMTVDMSIVHLAEREAAAAADAAANDAVTWGLDETTLYQDGEYRLDAGRVRESVNRSLAAHEISGRLSSVSVSNDIDSVSVNVEIEVDYVFARALPGAADGTTVSASSTATAVRP